MRKSLKRKLAITFIGLMLLTLLVIGLINTLFLEKYYTSQKSISIQEVYTQLNKMDISSLGKEGANEESLNISDDFKRFCAEKNISWAISDAQSQIFLTQSRESELLKARLFGYLNLTIQGKDNTKILKQTKNYRLQQVRDKYLDTDYLEMWGYLENENPFIIRTPIGSIRDSVKISNMFYLYIGITMILVSGVIIWILTKHIAKPISELTGISERMANLDFEARYTSGGDDEIGVLGENFNKMSQELEKTISELKSANNTLQKDIDNKIQVDEMRKEFLANVSHELKTPIALIQGYAEGLKECINDDEESREFYCEVIMDESAKMNHMVKKLLTLNQLEFGKEQVNLERFDIVELVRGVVTATQILAQPKGVEVIFQEQEPLYVWSDEFKIEEVVTNYISNALNHVKNENTIEVRIQQAEGKVRVSVFNTGDPIADEDIDKIWTKFYKVDKARTREYGGSGIGLSIVKAIMDSIQQPYGVKNYENGVEFWFKLEKQ